MGRSYREEAKGTDRGKTISSGWDRLPEGLEEEDMVRELVYNQRCSRLSGLGRSQMETWGDMST